MKRCGDDDTTKINALIFKITNVKLVIYVGKSHTPTFIVHYLF